MAQATAGGPLALLKGQKLQDIPKVLKEEADKWMVTQPPWVEAVSTGLFGSVQGAFLGGLMGYVSAAAGPNWRTGRPTQRHACRMWWWLNSGRRRGTQLTPPPPAAIPCRR